jgi:hypothetical protein
VSADRWEWLEGVRATSLEDAIMHEAARALADELLAWPPLLSWQDERAEAEFAPLFALDAHRPSREAFEHGFRLARWELERAVEAIDHSMRNNLLGALLAYDRLAAHFLWRWVPEWLLELKDRTGPRITRAHLVAALDQAAARVRGRLTAA